MFVAEKVLLLLVISLTAHWEMYPCDIPKVDSCGIEKLCMIDMQQIYFVFKPQNTVTSPIQIQGDRVILTTNLAALRLCEILR